MKNVLKNIFLKPVVRDVIRGTECVLIDNKALDLLVHPVKMAVCKQMPNCYQNKQFNEKLIIVRIQKHKTNPMLH